MNTHSLELPSGAVKITEQNRVTTLAYAEVTVDRVELNVGAHCAVMLFDQTGKPIERKSIFITGADYDKWIADDDIINLVLEKTGLQRYIPPPTPETAPNESA